MKNLENWARLAAAAFDAKNDLARLIPDLDRGIAAADTSVLLRVRALAIRHAEALKSALRTPAAGGRHWRANSKNHHGSEMFRLE